MNFKLVFDSVVLSHLFKLIAKDPKLKHTLMQLPQVNKKFYKIARPIIIDNLTLDDWELISIHKHVLTEDFMRKYKNKIDWYWISQSQTLSEKFIREFSNKVNWTNISRFQILSEDFIREFQYKVDWFFIQKYQKISSKFMKNFIHVRCRVVVF